ncbi:FeoA family protein [Novipirellula artificiosorum]|uniref:FeoA family protein n=1 Tax=Novipirellula artificiosorum TaxID=2528016 RepID=UPI0018CD1CCF|nr:FeoA family protein [Novipirellula artificiosorum]
MTTLDQLQPGQFGQIVRIDGFDGIASRLREMGFVPGQPVQFLRTAPLGDPMKCSVQGSRIAVRNGEARRVYIEPMAAPIS